MSIDHDDLLTAPAVDIPIQPLDFQPIWLPSDNYFFADTVEEAIKDGRLPQPCRALPQSFLSTTQIELFLRCPKQYEFRYIERLRGPVSPALIQGSVIHKVVEQVYSALIAGKPAPPMEFALDSYSDLVKASLEKDEINLSDEAKTDFFFQGTSLVKEWYLMLLPTVTPLEVEKPFVVSIASIPVVGVIDLIDREGPKTGGPEVDWVADNKVVGKKPTQTDADNSLQLTLYSAVTGLPNQRLDGFIKTKRPKIEVVRTSRTQKDVKWLTKLVSSVGEAIGTGVFPPCSPGSWGCSEKWCSYWEKCRGGV